MGSKGTTQNIERPLSPDELRLLSTQSDMMDSGIAIAQEQEARAQENYQQYKDSYEGVETGMIDDNARRSNGYTNGMSGDYAPSPSVTMRREGAMYGNQTQAPVSLPRRSSSGSVSCANCGRTTTPGSPCEDCGNPLPDVSEEQALKYIGGE